MKSVKKTFSKSLISRFSINYISQKINNYKAFFKAHRFDNTPTARNYILGLLKCEKGQGNMERMEEEIPETEHKAYQHFITNSNWDCEGLQTSVAIDSSKALAAHKKTSKKSTGYIVDESAHLKKGKESVGVSRQYAGIVGKVDNSQVGVYGSLVNEKYATIINQRLFLPQSWTDNPSRCQKAGIPKEFQTFKTKPQLALEMIKQDIERGVEFDWIGGDGLYGHNTELCDALDQIGQFFVLDVHKDETVYLEEPTIFVPTKKQGKGRKPTKLKSDKPAIRLDKLIKEITDNQWVLQEIRDTTKGLLKLFVYKTEVWTWDKKQETASRRTLIITKTTDSKPRIKYSISNGELEQYTHQEYAYFVAQRYWVERTFDNAKNELNMSGYQFRKWKSWQHHHSLVMLASLLIMNQQIENQTEIPLLSFRDARILIIIQIFGTEKDLQLRLKQMEKRHKKRQYDIDRNRRLSIEKQKL